MQNEINLIKNNDKRDWSDMEWVKEFYEWLQKEPAENITTKPIGLSPKKAFEVIYYLQEQFPLLPDKIEKCDVCNELFDSYSQGHSCEAKGKHFCSDGCEWSYNQTHRKCNKDCCK